MRTFSKRKPNKKFIELEFFFQLLKLVKKENLKNRYGIGEGVREKTLRIFNMNRVKVQTLVGGEISDDQLNELYDQLDQQQLDVLNIDLGVEQSGGALFNFEFQNAGFPKKLEKDSG